MPTLHFLFGGGALKWYFEIWSSKIYLDLKVPNLPMFYFLGWGGGGGVVKWHFEICSPKIHLPTLHFWGRRGSAKVALWNLKSKNPTWLESSKLPTFHFHRGGGKVALWSLKSNFNLTWNFQICKLFISGGRARGTCASLGQSGTFWHSFPVHGKPRVFHSSLCSETNQC